MEKYYRETSCTWDNENDMLAISTITYRVVRKTSKGKWITPTWNPNDDTHLKFILDGEGRRFAYPTREAARANFIARKKSEIGHCARQHDRAARYLKLAETMKFGTQTEALHELHPGGLELIVDPA